MSFLSADVHEPGRGDRAAWFFRCDCGIESPERGTRAAATAVATGWGWLVETVVGGLRGTCPRCVEQEETA